MSKRVAPGAGDNFTTLPQESEDRHEVLVDLFGRYIMWLRDWTNDSTKSLVRDRDVREKLGTILRQPYDEASQLAEIDRERAVRLAEASTDAFIRRLLQVLSHQGMDFQYGIEHVVRFRLEMEILTKDNREIVHEEVINRGGRKHFADYWGKWLNRFIDDGSSEPA
jgi:hypothetical protein